MIEQILNCCCDEHIDAFNRAKARARAAGITHQTPEEWQAQDAIDKHLVELRLIHHAD